MGALPEPERTSRPAWIAQSRTTADSRTVVLADRDWEYGLAVDGIAVLRAAGPRRRGRRRRLTLKRWAVAFSGAVIVGCRRGGDALGGFGLLTAALATLGAGAAGATANLIEG